MTSAAPRPGGGLARLRPFAAPAALLLLLVVGVALFARRPPSQEPLAPDSVEPDGTKALVEILRGVGADVEVSAALPRAPRDGGPAAVLLLRDDRGAAAASSLEAYVRDGGVLVLTDPSSTLTADLAIEGTTNLGIAASSVPRGCDVPALAAADRVLAPASPTFTVPAGWTGCYLRDEAAWLAMTDRGQGTLVVLGGPGFLTNGLIGSEDNAALAVALLAPEPGTSVAVLEPGVALPGGGDRSLADLIDRGVVVALWQLAGAFVVFALWRARRLGAPVREPQQVTLAGSELVVAVGNLLQRGRRRGRAAALLRGDLRRALTERLGLPAGTDVDTIADTAAARTSASRDDVLRALTGAGEPDDAGLVELARLVEDVRAATLTGPADRAPDPDRGALVDH